MKLIDRIFAAHRQDLPIAGRSMVYGPTSTFALRHRSTKFLKANINIAAAIAHSTSLATPRELIRVSAA
jgi:hypothetical protein